MAELLSSAALVANSTAAPSLSHPSATGLAAVTSFNEPAGTNTNIGGRDVSNNAPYAPAISPAAAANNITQPTISPSNISGVSNSTLISETTGTNTNIGGRDVSNNAPYVHRTTTAAATTVQSPSPVSSNNSGVKAPGWLEINSKSIGTADFLVNISRAITSNAHVLVNTTRSISSNNDFSSDTKRQISYPLDFTVDTKRKTAILVNVFTDIQRNIFTNVDLLTDTSRRIAGGVSADFVVDIERKTAVSFDTTINTKRQIISSAEYSSDTCRDIFISVNISIDTYRKVITETDLQVDARRVIANQSDIAIDTIRSVKTVVGSLDLLVDTERQIAITASIFINSTRTINASADYSVQAIRKISTSLNNVPITGLSTYNNDRQIENVSFAIDAGQLTESYTIELYQDVAIKQNFTLQVGDFPCTFRINDLTKVLTKRTIQARMDMDEWIYSAIYLFVTAPNIVDGGTTVYKYPFASTVLASFGVIGNYTDFLASNLNFILNGVYASNIQPQTPKQILTSLFSWSNSLPRIKHVILYRNGHGYVYQRNLLPVVSNLDDTTKWKVDPKNDESTLVRTLIHSKSQYYIPLEDTSYDLPLTGTIQFGGASMLYSGGLLIRKTNTDSSYTTYLYSNLGNANHAKFVLIDEKSFNAAHNIISETVNAYDTYQNIIYICESMETQYTYDASGALSNTHKIQTNHIPLGNNFWGQEVYEGDVNSDGSIKFELKNTALSQGAAGGEASLYSQKISRRSVNQSDPSLYLNGTAINGVPVAPDITTARLIAIELNWMDGKIQQTVTLDVYNLPGNEHVIDVLEMVTYQGDTWYVDKNNASVTPKKTVQAIQLTRWYDGG